MFLFLHFYQISCFIVWNVPEKYDLSCSESDCIIIIINFHSDLLSDLVPQKLSDHLYTKCGGLAKGISFREVVVILVLITNGTRDEKCHFLFHLASADGNSVHPKELEDFYYMSEEVEYLLRRVILPWTRVALRP